jgi:integrase
MTKHNNDKKGSRLSFHSFRHWFATEMLRQSGGNLVVTSRLLRHASPVVTMRYADLISGEERKAVELLFNDINWQEIDQIKSVKSNARYRNSAGDFSNPLQASHGEDLRSPR